MPLDCLVINLTRLGDLLQSQPLFYDLEAKGFKTGLICLENFAATLPLLAKVEQTWPLKGAKLLALLNTNWLKASSEILNFVKTIQKEARPKYVINLTATIAARILARLIASDSAKIIGFGVDNYGFGQNIGAWSTFLSGTTSCRQNAVFNIVDMFRLLASPILKDWPYQERRGLVLPKTRSPNFIKKLLPQSHNLPTETKGYLALQLGASDDSRRWPLAYFAELSQILWDKLKYVPILTGSKGELPLAQDYEKLALSPYLSAVGKTNLSELGELLAQVKLLVSNDTGTMHLAAGLGTPCLGFFLATAQPWDTAPYLKNCLCLEPDLPCHPCPFQTPCNFKHACQTVIRPLPVAELIINYLTTKSWQPLKEDYPLRVWETDLDPYGLATVKCLSKHNRDDRTLFIKHQRNFWRQFLGEIEGQKKAQVLETILPCSKDFLKNITPILQQVSQILLLLEEQGPILLKSPGLGKLFLRNCDRIETLLSTTPNLLSLRQFWQELRTDQGQDLKALLAVVKLFRQNLDNWQQDLEYGTNCANERV
ncbi:MAG: glycosyltransferase family 9 protein [Desulfovibrionaceae bacterium]|nr:glycosyltransferase family 9 protein [Desulfovibrionaceae bacterium]